MLKIGLTGGIGSGKSTACQYFSELGVPIIDADAIARELTQAGQPVLSRIAEVFGPDILNPNGELDRPYLRQRVFANAELRRQLESILHPLIKQVIQARIAQLTAPYVILAVPLLIESQWTDLVDRVLVIDSPMELQIQRSTQRDTSSESQIRAIIKSQTDRNTRCAAADDIIVNDSDLAKLHEQVTQLHQQYLELAAQSSH
jgi:dephospho-CoA kinase